ncbi:DUF255 domain-containing protein [Planctomycetota bacterium]
MSIGILFVVFYVFVATVYLTNRKESIDWIEDYEMGIKMAQQQNKPVLLAFYKRNTTFTSDMEHNTYNHPRVKEYVERIFIPVLIDVDKQPEIAKKYNVNYYPTHYIRYANREEVGSPLMGYDSAGLFIQKLTALLKDMNISVK